MKKLNFILLIGYKLCGLEKNMDTTIHISIQMIYEKYYKF